jgi:hypothetical protein
VPRRAREGAGRGLNLEIRPFAVQGLGARGMQRSGIGDDQRHAGSDAEPAQVAAVALQIVCRICAEDAVPGQKLIELGAGGETKQPAQFRPAEMPCRNSSSASASSTRCSTSSPVPRRRARSAWMRM